MTQGSRWRSGWWFANTPTQGFVFGGGFLLLALLNWIRIAMGGNDVVVLVLAIFATLVGGLLVLSGVVMRRREVGTPQPTASYADELDEP